MLRLFKWGQAKKQPEPSTREPEAPGAEGPRRQAEPDVPPQPDAVGDPLGGAESPADNAHLSPLGAQPAAATQVLERPVEPSPTDLQEDEPPAEGLPEAKAETPEADEASSLSDEPVTFSVEDAMTAALNVDGATAAMLVDYQSGMALGTIGSGIDLEIAGAGNTQVVRATLEAMAELGVEDTIEDILITLGQAYHIIRPLPESTLFFYMVLGTTANLGLARHKLTQIVDQLDV